MGECIRMISDIMSFTKQKNVPAAAVFLDSEKAFDSIEWNYLKKYLEVLRFCPELRQWIKVVYNHISSSVLNSGFICKGTLLAIQRSSVWVCAYHAVVSYPRSFRTQIQMIRTQATVCFVPILFAVEIRFQQLDPNSVYLFHFFLFVAGH